MSKDTLLIAGLALVVGIGIGRASAPANPSTSIAEITSIQTVSAATLAEYSENAVNALDASGEPYALFFHSESCATCRSKEANLTAEPRLSQLDRDRIIKVPYEQAPTALLQKHGITKYDQFVFCDGSGECETKKGATAEDITTHIKADKMMNDSMNDDQTSAAGSYEAYPSSAELAALAASGDKFTMFFHSKTCATCRRMDGEISERVSEIPADHTIVKIDYETADRDLLKEHGVTKYHTFVTFDGSAYETNPGLSTDQLLASIQ